MNPAPLTPEQDSLAKACYVAFAKSFYDGVKFDYDKLWEDFPQEKKRGYYNGALAAIEYPRREEDQL
jgi:hypothetical protein